MAIKAVFIFQSKSLVLAPLSQHQISDSWEHGKKLLVRETEIEWYLYITVDIQSCIQEMICVICVCNLIKIIVNRLWVSVKSDYIKQVAIHGN